MCVRAWIEYNNTLVSTRSVTQWQRSASVCRRRCGVHADAGDERSPRKWRHCCLATFSCPDGREKGREDSFNDSRDSSRLRLGGIARFIRGRSGFWFCASSLNSVGDKLTIMAWQWHACMHAFQLASRKRERFSAEETSAAWHAVPGVPAMGHGDTGPPHRQGLCCAVLWPLPWGTGWMCLWPVPIGSLAATSCLE